MNDCDNDVESISEFIYLCVISLNKCSIEYQHEFI